MRKCFSCCWSTFTLAPPQPLQKPNLPGQVRVPQAYRYLRPAAALKERHAAAGSAGNAANGSARAAGKRMSPEEYAAQTLPLLDEELQAEKLQVLPLEFNLICSSRSVKCKWGSNWLRQVSCCTSDSRLQKKLGLKQVRGRAVAGGPGTESARRCAAQREEPAQPALR